MYLIKELDINWDARRETDAYKYDTIGYTQSREEAEYIVRLGRLYDVNDCWAIKGTLPQYKIAEIKKIFIDDTGNLTINSNRS